MSYFTPQRRISAPSGPRTINWGHSLAQGLMSAYAGDLPYPKNRWYTEYQPTRPYPEFRATPTGLGINAGVNTEFRYLNSVNSGNNTLMAQVVAVGQVSAARQICNLQYGQFLFIATNNVGVLYAGFMDSGFVVRDMFTSANMLLAEPNTIAVRYNGSAVDFFLNGVKFGSNSVNAPYAWSGNNVGVIGDPLVPTPFVAHWYRALSDSEIWELGNRPSAPYQLFAPQRPIIFSLPGPTGPVLSAATAIDIGSTSARPRVTITI